MERCSSSELPPEVNSKIILKPFHAPQFQKDHEEQAKECVQVNTQIISKPFQASQSQKDQEEQAKECVQALQLLKGHGKQSNTCTQVGVIKGKPRWLERFLRRTFFDPCPEHPTGRNDLNKYCIDCDAPLCKYCLSLPSHAGHRLLKIHRHCYKDVVLLDEIKRHIDSSQIQPFRCNRQMVIALTPLPHIGAETKTEKRCHTCNRVLFQYNTYSYCAISCKVEAFNKKKNDSDPPFLSIHQEEEPELSRKRKRKGIPRRSPFF